jgi:hypothetical protein
MRRNDMEPKRTWSDVTFEEMERIVSEAHQIDHYYRQNEQREWEAEQRTKAPAILSLLQRHLPVEALQVIEEFLSTRYGCDCLRDVLQGPQPGGRFEDDLLL